MGIKDIVDDTLSSKYTPTQRQATYVQYIRLAKLCVNDRALLPPAERLNTEGGTGKNLGISHLDFSSLYSSDLDEVELMFGALKHFITAPPRVPRSMLNLFCHKIWGCGAVQSICRVCYQGPPFLPLRHVSEVVGPGKFLPKGQTAVFQQHAFDRFDYNPRNRNIPARRTRQRSMRSDLSLECKTYSSPTLLLLCPCSASQQNGFQGVPERDVLRAR